jgi:hypothetical protein
VYAVRIIGRNDVVVVTVVVGLKPSTAQMQNRNGKSDSIVVISLCYADNEAVQYCGSLIGHCVMYSRGYNNSTFASSTVRYAHTKCSKTIKPKFCVNIRQWISDWMSAGLSCSAAA